MKVIRSIVVGCFLMHTTLLVAQINQAKVYWVGHSLISHTDQYTAGSNNLIGVMNTFAVSQGKTYNYHQHTTPGAPLGWNWGSTTASWNDIQSLIQPLINTTDSNYGTFDVLVLTEAINLYAYHEWWNPSFYARKFYNASLNANPNTRLFMYESWHHFQASDEGLRDYYGPMANFDWRQYTLDVRTLWETIIDEAIDASLTPLDANYTYQGSGIDPGIGNDVLDIKIIPTGTTLVAVLDRLQQNLATDNWDYNGDDLTGKDFFVNPLVNFPTDLTTVAHTGDALDDVHPSNILIYLNALVHYAVIYQDNPINLPVTNSVPVNISTIFKDVVWSIVVNDSRTGVAAALSINDINKNLISLYPNPAKNTIFIKESQKYTILDSTGKIILKGKSNHVTISNLEKGIYFIKTKKGSQKFIKN